MPTWTIKAFIKQNSIYLLFFLIAALLSIKQGLQGGDFDVYMHASKRLLAQENIYNPPHYNGLQYYYSPLFAITLIPVIYLGDTFAKIAWLLLNSVLLIRIWKLAEQRFDFSSFSSKQYQWWVGISFCLMFGTVLLNYQALQMTIYMLWSILESLALFKKNKSILGSAILALAINIKILPLVVIPYLVFRKQWKAFILVIGFFCLFLFAPKLILDTEYASTLNSSWWGIINPVNSEHVVEHGEGFYSISALIPAYFSNIPATIAQEPPINVLSLNENQVSLLLNLIRLMLVLSMLLPLLSKLDKQYKGFLSVSYLCLLIPLVFPHQRGYSFFFLTPMVLFFTYYFMVDRSRVRSEWFTFSLFVIGVLLISPLWGRDIIGNYINTYKQYKLIPVGAILIIPAFISILLRHGFELTTDWKTLFKKSELH